MSPTISLLITAYNYPERLERVLIHHLRQRIQPLEIIICDDGSSSEVKSLVERLAVTSKTPLRHVYQPDNGWDAPGIRNLGAMSAKGDYLVLTDSDCIPHPKFIHDHRRAAEKGCFVFGERSHVVQEHAAEFSTRPDILLGYLLRRRIKKISCSVRHPFEPPKVFSRSAFNSIHQIGGLAIACNFGVWKNDFMAANGFDESHKAWWPEDGELSLRLLNTGLRVKKYRNKCLVYHLDHGPSVKSWC